MYHNYANEKCKYLSVMCKGCKHKCLLWFTRESNERFVFKRAPYGMMMHHDCKKHNIMSPNSI